MIKQSFTQIAEHLALVRIWRLKLTELRLISQKKPETEKSFVIEGGGLFVPLNKLPIPLSI
jgi:hypothetical protein